MTTPDHTLGQWVESHIFIPAQMVWFEQWTSNVKARYPEELFTVYARYRCHQGQLQRLLAHTRRSVLSLLNHPQMIQGGRHVESWVSCGVLVPAAETQGRIIFLPSASAVEYLLPRSLLKIQKCLVYIAVATCRNTNSNQRRIRHSHTTPASHYTAAVLDETQPGHNQLAP